MTMGTKTNSAKIDWRLFWIIFLGMMIFIVLRLMIPAKGLMITWILWLPILGVAVFVGAPYIKLDAKSRAKQVRTMILAVFAALVTIFGLEFFAG